MSHQNGSIRNCPDVRILLAEAFASYAAGSDAANELERALALGINEQNYWRARLALLTAEQNPSEAVKALESNPHPFAVGLRHLLAEEWRDGIEALRSWSPSSPRDGDIRALLRARGLEAQGERNAAIAVLEEVVGITGSAQVWLELGVLLTRRAHSGRATSRVAELQRAAEICLRARDMRRQWRGDSAECVAAAADALILAHDPDNAWSVLRASPEGRASEVEAKDPRVTSKAAMVAASLGRISLARSLASKASPFEAATMEAMLAESSEDHSPAEVTGRAQQLWDSAWQQAATDDQRLVAARGILLNGGDARRH